MVDANKIDNSILIGYDLYFSKYQEYTRKFWRVNLFLISVQ